MSTVKDMGFSNRYLESAKATAKPSERLTSVYNLKKFPINHVKLDTVGKVPPRPAAVTFDFVYYSMLTLALNLLVGPLSRSC